MRRLLSRSSASTPLAHVLLGLALSALAAVPAGAQGVQELVEQVPPTTTRYDWCVGQGLVDGSGVPNSKWATANGINITDFVSTWSGDNDSWSRSVSDTARTADGYKIQVNYWNSVLSGVTGQGGTSIGYSTGTSCIWFDNAANPSSRFKITVAGDPPVARTVDDPATAQDENETQWAIEHASSYPWYGESPFFWTADGIQATYPGGSTAGGPTGYPSIWIGCSWADANSCTRNPDTNSILNPEWYGVANAGAEDPNTSPRLLPRQLKHVTSMPATWTIEYPAETGARADAYQVWDAAFDIWFDKTGDPNKGSAPYGATAGRGQNDGLEIMVWMDHNHTYVDAPDTADNPGGKNANGYAQPSGWPREVVLINGVLYDVWTSRLNNPYFGYEGQTNVLAGGAEPSTCPTLTVNGAASDVVCGVEWNVVSFVARDGYRAKRMDLDAKVFSDYILGRNACDATGACLWQIQEQTSRDAGGQVRSRDGGASGVLLCPASTMGDQQADPVVGGIPCLSEDWVLTSVQAGFEPWVGGNGLETTGFKSYALITSAAVQSGRTNDAVQPVVFWGAPWELVYDPNAPDAGGNTCPGVSSVTFDIWVQPDNGEPGYWAHNADNTWTGQGIAMAGPNGGGKFTYMVPALVPSHGPATVTFHPAGCADSTLSMFIDPSGQVFYSDGTTPVPGARATLLYYPSGDPVPNHNAGLGSNPVMQPNDNTTNWMPTDQYGSYGWNVIPGDYQVSAEKEDCGFVISPVQHVVSEPIINLNLVLPCAPPLPYHNFGVTLTVTNSWPTGGPNGTGGYCATVHGTNATGKALDWTAAFALPEPGTIYDSWNATFSQLGNVNTRASGIAWNDVLQNGQSLQGVGFCVNRGSNTGPTMHSLSVTKAGAGSGTVTSSPGGIDCGGTCSASYAAGTSVTLTAAPSSGSVFAGWSGACSGTGTCTVAMNGDLSATASFNPQPLTTRLTITNNWTTGGPHNKGGYCANVAVTNNSSAAVDWKVTFPLPEVSTIYSFWNAIWSQSGSQITAEGVSWNNILQAGQSTRDVGFCANR